MSVGLPSDEVAEDYKNSLEDLTMNSRYEISNLTVIAKENTEHGMAISRVLENHIRNTQPDRKLPALYVLDSIVKNVGTPYTLFLGRNLYYTFMDAYSLVNNQVRKKLDEMLKTWKEPVPGSLDPRPVFPVETTRPIENALIKARTLAIKQQPLAKTQQDNLSRNHPTATPSTSWRNTPTPPQNNGRYPPPASQIYPQQNIQNGHTQARPYGSFQQYPSQQAQSPLQQAFQQPSPFHASAQQASNLEMLHRDIANLVTSARLEFAASLFDPSIQQRLKALLDLQAILKNQQLPPDQIQLIKDQVAQLSASARTATTTPSPATVNTPIPSAVPPPSLQQQQQQQPQLQPQQAQKPQQQTDLQALLSSNALAGLLASAAKSQQTSSTPPVPQISLGHASLPPRPPINDTPVTAGNEISLIASLRAAGIISFNSSTPVNAVASPSQPQYPFQPLPAAIRTPPIASANLANSSPVQARKDIGLSTASLKIPKRYLVPNLYEARSNQCTTCGRRFFASEEGKQKKARHLDWHFRTHQRLADSIRRGQSRSWYVDEMEWIKSRDNIEEEASESSSGKEASKALIAAIAAQNDPKNKYIPVPDDLALANAPCPICQEKFETSWNDGSQDFVWMDAIKIGARVYHGSCYAELKKDGGNTPLRTSRTATPESVLGKRKAVGLNDIDSMRTKMPKGIKA